MSFHDPRELDMLASRTWAWEPACHILWTLGTYERAIGNLHYSEAIDRASYVATPVMGDGCDGPPLELRGLFEQFLREVS